MATHPDCDHQCSGNCRKVGCNCLCGEWHDKYEPEEAMPPTPKEQLVEEMAAMEHTRWSNWQSYLHSKCTRNEDGSLNIPAHLVLHWERQIGTPYSQLTEHEKESDRAEVRPYIEYAASQRAEIIAKIEGMKTTYKPGKPFCISCRKSDDDWRNQIIGEILSTLTEEE